MGLIMELFFLMASIALVVVSTAVFRRTTKDNARSSPAVPTTIEVHDRAIARSMLVDHAATFSDRPLSPFHVKFVRAERVNRSYSISTAPHGPLWRALRRNLTAGILHPSRLRLLARLQRDAVDGLVTTLSSGCRTGGSSDGTITVVRDSLHTAVLTLLMRMCFGDDDYNGGPGVDSVHAVQRVLRDFFDGIVLAPVIAGSRTARLLHWRRWRRFLGVRTRMARLLLPLIAERQRRRRRCNVGAGFHPYVDSLLDLQVPTNYDDDDDDDDDAASGRRALTDDEKMTLVWEFLFSGTETVVSCVEWSLAHLVNQPEVQEKVHHELLGVDVNNSNGTPPPYPYLRAVILESLRLHPPVPFIQRDLAVLNDDGGAPLLPAAVINAHVPPPPGVPEDDERFVRFNIVLGAIGRDNRVWTADADEFRPERFLAGDEAAAVGAMPRPKDIRMLPFGVGTRHCPGMGLAMVLVRDLLAALVRGFDWGVPVTTMATATGSGGVDLTEVDGFVKHMKTPLMARITPRI